MACPGCQVVPRHQIGAGVLFLSPAIAHTRQHVSELASAAGFEVAQPHLGLLAITLSEGQLTVLAKVLIQGLSVPEIGACQVVLLPVGEEFGLMHLKQTRTLATLLAQEDAGWLRDMLDESRLTSHFQPIVHTRTPDKVFAYECLLRGFAADGSMVYPDRIFGAARSADLMFHVDHAARLTAIRESSIHIPDASIFINFNPTSIYDPAFCLRTTIDAARACNRPNESFVFEVIESDEIKDTGHLLRILKAYREAGFKVALDDLGAGYSSLTLLAELRPDFVKFDRELIRNIHADPYKASVARKLIEMARELGVATVAEGIEEKEEWQWLCEHDVDYVQGYLFARPDSPPPSPVTDALY